MAPVPRRRSGSLRSPAALLLVLAAGCGPSLAELIHRSDAREIARGEEGFADTVQVRYLRAGGWLIRRGDDAILAAPFYSNPDLAHVIGGEIACNERLVGSLLPPVGDVRAILVGHAHYDHLMDVPTIARERAREASVYASPTAAHILAAALPRERVVALASESLGDAERAGEWIAIPGTRARIMALRSEHAPHAAGIALYGGTLDRDLAELPRTADGWVLGEVLAFLIDLLDEDGSVAFRIHYQDACSNPPLGYPPPLSGRDTRRVDLAIACVPGYEEVRDYPEGIIARLRPRTVLCGHWEDFFRPPDAPLEHVPLNPPRRFLERLRAVLAPDARCFLPAPGSLYLFRTPSARE